MNNPVKTGSVVGRTAFRFGRNNQGGLKNADPTTTLTTTLIPSTQCITTPACPTSLK